MKPITEHPFTPELLTSKKYFWNCKTEKELGDYYSSLKTRTTNDHDALLSVTQSNRKVFRLLSTTIPTLDGWSSLEKTCAIAGLILATKPSLCFEVGVWAGRSLFAMGVAAQEIGKCSVIGVDAYNPQVSADKEDFQNAQWWGQQDHSIIEKKCRSLISNFGLSDITQLVVKKTDDVQPPPVINIFHCDASHTEQATKDVERFAPSIPLGGFAILDDLHWSQGGVMRAVDAMEDMGFEEAYRVVKHEEGVSNDWNLMQRVRCQKR